MSLRYDGRSRGANGYTHKETALEWGNFNCILFSYSFVFNTGTIAKLRLVMVTVKVLESTPLWRRNLMETSLPTIAGFISTGLFAFGTLPMLAKAFRTKNLASYSLGNIMLSNVGNLIYSLYVFHLPPGPIWFLHGYNLLSTGLMLVWYLRYEGRSHPPRSSGDHATTRFLPTPCCSSTSCA
jgi:uncharacterized protein with PQ loop repeat